MDGIKLSSLSPHQLGEISGFIDKYGLGIELGEEKTANFLLRLWNAEEEKRKKGEKYSKKMLKDAERLITSLRITEPSGAVAHGEAVRQKQEARQPRLRIIDTEVESMERRPKTGQEALELLMKGNRNFVEGKLTQYDVVQRRKELVNGQQPLAIVLGCSDSRIDPVKTFDANLGEIFAIESAGNVVDDVAIGSIEYGAEHLKAPLFVILAHEKCGAVTACCTGGHCEGHIKDIVKMIEPSVVKGNVEASTDANAKAMKECILHSSEVIRRLADEGKLKIVVAKYMLESGQVKILG